MSTPHTRYTRTRFVIYEETNWDPPDPVYGIATCNDCGALVTDTDLHDQFHDLNSIVVPRADGIRPL